MNYKSIVYVAIALLFVTGVSGCKTLLEVAQEKEYVEPDGVTLMSEAELRRALVGNTYEGVSVRVQGATYVEYIHPDGKISGLWKGTDRYKGEWVIAGKVWCYRYPTIRGCNTLARSGDTIHWYNLDGTTRGGKAQLLAGDPRNLSD